MAVTITTAQVRDAVRAGSSDAETEQIDRLRQVASFDD